MDTEIFADNSKEDDIAVLANLLSQVLDNAPEECLDCVTAYDEKTRVDYGIDEILQYIRGKYGDNF